MGCGPQVISNVAGVNLRKNRRLRRVTLPVPSILTVYWSCGLASITVPDASHFVGCGPCWFWTNTLSPGVSGGRFLAFLLRDSVVRVYLAFMASSLRLQASRHVERIAGFSNLESRFTKENASRSRRPNSISAGEMLQSGSGVLRICKIARKKLSLLMDPFGPILSINNRLHFLTATSALPLDCGK